jgi:hypothetical protein
MNPRIYVEMTEMPKNFDPAKESIIRIDEINLPYYWVFISSQKIGFFKFYVMHNLETEKFIEYLIVEINGEPNKRFGGCPETINMNGEEVVKNVLGHIKALKQRFSEFNSEKPTIFDFRQCKNIDEVMVILNASKEIKLTDEEYGKIRDEITEMITKKTEEEIAQIMKNKLKDEKERIHKENGGVSIICPRTPDDIYQAGKKIIERDLKQIVYDAIRKVLGRELDGIEGFYEWYKKKIIWELEEYRNNPEIKEVAKMQTKMVLQADEMLREMGEPAFIKMMNELSEKEHLYSPVKMTIPSRRNEKDN